MSIFDIVVVIALIYAVIRGYLNGFILELASLMALVFGILGAILISSWTETLLKRWWNWEYIGIIAFLITFISILIGASILARSLSDKVNQSAVHFLNRVAGSLFAVFKTAFILSIIVAFLQFFDWEEQIIPPSQKRQSKLYTPLKELAPSVFPYLRFEKPMDRMFPVQESN